MHTTVEWEWCNCDAAYDISRSSYRGLMVPIPFAYSSPVAAARCITDAGQFGSRRDLECVLSGSKWLYAGRLTTIVAVLPALSACATGHIGTPRPDRRRRKINSDRFSRDHAGDRRADHRRHFWIRLVVSRLQRQGAPSSGLGLFGPYRTCRLGHSGTGRYAAGRRGMDRIT